MSALFETGHIIDVILALVALEAAALVLYRRRTGKGPSVAQVAGLLFAGVFLMLALRAALTGAGWTSVAFWLSASLIAHLADLRQRWSVPG